jgi:hypothetical protein
MGGRIDKNEVFEHGYFKNGFHNQSFAGNIKITNYYFLITIPHPAISSTNDS